MSVRHTANQRRGSVPEHAAIMAAITKCIERLGLEKCTMEDFARAVGISRISLYRAYGNKTNLIDAVLAYRASQFNRAVGEKLAPLATMTEALEFYFIATTRQAKRDKTIRYLIDSQYVFKAVFSQNSKAMQEPTARLWLPMIAKHCPAESAIRQLDPTAVINWILAMQATLSRIAIESDCDDREIAFFVRSFIAPAFTSGRLDMPSRKERRR